MNQAPHLKKGKKPASLGIQKILIANRGEIAIRIIRACSDLGVKSVAVYSEADRNSLHVMLASEAYYIGPAESRLSYLNIEKIIETALRAGAEAIHPGYGFLSENPDFAKASEQAGLLFIGPSARIISAMGDKIQARKLMRSYGVPVLPGGLKPLKNAEEALAEGEKTGWPVLLKASAGGGGKGIRAVHGPKDMPGAFRACRREAKTFFKSEDLFIEKLIENPKHIEIQVLADHHGHAVHLFERECSVQRRRQKLIEESPSPLLPRKVREKMSAVAVHAVQKMGYTNAGTFEFIYDSSHQKFYFLEMNTRLQVEHPVTEMVTGVDIVREQIFITAGQALKIKQKDLEQKGHAIEMRICAEDPKSFLPSPGRIRRCRIPQGPFVRVDGYCYMGYKVPVHYDPMVAKLICYGKDREDCISKAQRALDEFSLTGIKTNVLLHKNILRHKKFLDGSYTNNFIEEEIGGKNQKKLARFVDERVFLISAAIFAYRQNKKKPEQNTLSRWREKARRESLRS